MPATVTPDLLKQLRRELDQYRKIGKRAVFPNELKHKVVTLSCEYPATTLIQSLGIPVCQPAPRQ